MASDARLLRASRGGDQQAFGRIVRRYQSLVCAVTYSSTGDLSASEDLAQETFLTAWKRLDSPGDPRRLRAWLCTMARTLAVDWLRRRERDVVSGAVSVEQAGHLESTTPTPVERSLSDERTSVVWGALNEMPEEYRIPLILYYREQQSVGRVAEALDLPRTAVKSRPMRGRSMLKDKVVAVVEETLTATRPGEAFCAAVVAAVAGTAAKNAAAGTTVLGLSLAEAVLVVLLIAGAAVGTGLALRSSAGLKPAGRASAAVAIEAAEGAQPTIFNSRVAFDVCAVIGGEHQRVGKTPSDGWLVIPACQWWYVAPLPPVDMEVVLQEVQAQKIPGLRLTYATDADLEYLNGLTALQCLYLFATTVTDAGMEYLTGLTALEGLDLSGTQVTDAGLGHLEGLTALRTFKLGWTAVTDAGLAHLKGLTALQHLDLSETNVTDAGLEHLKGLTVLRQLGLSNTQVTDAGLEHLKGLTALSRLDVRGTQVSGAGVDQLKKSLPNVQVYR
jgi:RNA polymerase sigma factor (sigma-70 family)